MGYSETSTNAQPAEEVKAALVTEIQLEGLPPDMQRYLNYAQVVDKEVITSVRLKQEGTYRTQAGQKWFPMVAEQYITTTPPGFTWHMTSHPLPLISLSVTDQFHKGRGNLRVKLWSFITLGNASGPEMDQGELQRYLGEMAWYPTAWLSNAVELCAVDTKMVQARLRQKDVSATAMLHFNEQGQIARVTMERYMEAHGRYELNPWSGEFYGYKQVDGMWIPTRFEITWHLASGDFTWLRSELTEIEFNQSGKVTKF